MHKVRYDFLEGLPLGSSWLNGSQLKRTLAKKLDVAAQRADLRVWRRQLWRFQEINV